MSTITVELLDHMGSDLSVVNAARVSFLKESKFEVQTFEDEEKAERYAAETKGSINYDYVYSAFEWMGDYPVKHLSTRDAKLVEYLARHKHKSPFNHAFASFRVKAPLVVARQLVKHEYLPWNEVSRRYVEDGLEWFFPDTWRAAVADKKQGSGEPLPDWVQEEIQALYQHTITTAQQNYEGALALGLCPEQARMFLPTGLMTEWIWSGSLAAFAKMVGLRTKPDAQEESRVVAEQVSTLMNGLFPVSWDALQKHPLN